MADEINHGYYDDSRSMGGALIALLLVIAIIVVVGAFWWVRGGMPMMGYITGGLPFGGAFLILLIIVFVILILFWAIRSLSYSGRRVYHERTDDDELDEHKNYETDDEVKRIAKRRYALGEITKKEYYEILKELEK